MRVRFIVAVLSIAAAMVTIVPLAAQFGRPPSRATRGLSVWADVEYRGASHTFISDVRDISSTGLARAISSLQPGNGESWQVCTEPNYAGRCRVFSDPVANLQEINWSDVIQSVRQMRPDGTFGQSGGYGSGSGSGNGTTAGLEIYSGRNFTGRRYVLQEATSDFRQFEFNDRAMSVRVPRGTTWEVCVNIEYDECRVISADVADLNEVGLLRMISSARPRAAAGSWWGGGRGRARGQATPAIVVFEGVNYSGRSATYESEQQSISGTLLRSLQLRGGRWQICDRPQFGGNCVMVSSDVPDVSNLGLRGRVASMRPQ
jgi:hypothetical protein